MQSPAWLGRYIIISQDDSCIFRGQRPTLRRLCIVYHLLHHRARTHSYLWVLRSSFYQLIITKLFKLELSSKALTLYFMQIGMDLWLRCKMLKCCCCQDLLQVCSLVYIVGWHGAGADATGRLRQQYVLRTSPLSTRSAFIIEWLPPRVIRIANYFLNRYEFFPEISCLYFCFTVRLVIALSMIKSS